jgi:hypothetical protein
MLGRMLHGVIEMNNFTNLRLVASIQRCSRRPKSVVRQTACDSFGKRTPGSLGSTLALGSHEDAFRASLTALGWRV